MTLQQRSNLAVLLGNGLSIAQSSSLTIPSINDEVVRRINT